MSLKPHIVPYRKDGHWRLAIYGTWRHPFTVAEKEFTGLDGQTLGDLIRAVGRLNPQPRYYPCWFTLEGKRNAHV